MSGINKTFILGNLGADPELKMLPGGNAVLKLRVATDESWWDKDKVRHDRTEWHRVTVFGKRAEGLAKFVRKGMKVAVDGSLRTSTYEKEGQKHYSTEIVANEVVVATPRSDSSRSSVGADAPFSPSSSSTINGGFVRAPEPAFATDIPF